MSAEQPAARGEALDPKTAKLIDRAHRCEKLPSIEDHLPFRNFAHLWNMQAAERGDSQWIGYYPCAADDEEPLWITYREFAGLIDSVATLLAKRYNICSGGTLATLTVTQPLTVAIYFAAWRLGARIVPINPGETDDRAKYILENSGATLLIAHRSCREDYASVEAKLPSGLQKAMIVDRGGDDVTPGWDDLPDLLANGEIADDLPDADGVSWDAEALVVYTSGTTGKPKGVVLNQKQLFADAYGISKWHGIDERTVMMNVLPIHHVNGIVVTLLTPAFVGASVIVNKRFRSKGFWQKLARHDVGIVSVVPTLLQFLLDADEDLDPATISGFRHFICGAGPLSVELAREFQDRFGLKILHGYGLSETVCYSCFLPIHLPWHEHNGWMCDHGFPSIGAAIDSNEMDIHDAKGGPVPDRQKGEIVIRGHNVMNGYFRNPKANAEAFAFGWFRSGDEGFKLRGQDGLEYYFITGRIKELIIRGGINLSPFEIDEVINSMPGVRVGLAVGFENRYYGEEVGAYVQVEPGKTLTEEQVIEHCRQHLSASKCPKVVLFGDDIPVTSTGKYQRGKLKHLFEAYKNKQFRG